MRSIKSFGSFETEKPVNEHQEQQNYMFFGNLKTIKRLVDELLEMDEATVDQMLSNGHDWAGDHIATSKDDIEEVFNFLAGHNAPDHEHSDEDMLDRPEPSHAEDYAHGEEEKSIKGFEDFQ